MKYDYYKELRISEDYEIYDFTSTGIKGDIIKRVRFELVEKPATYNLAFGNLMDDGDIDDYSISDNKDMAKILASIAVIVKIFLKEYPERTVSFRGNTAERTRLYRMAIGNNLDELLDFFNIYGIQKGGEISFFTRDEEYFAFLAKKKS